MEDYMNRQTEVFKGTTRTDLNVVYEGDRVKLIFDTYDTNYIASVEVIVKAFKLKACTKEKSSALNQRRINSL